MHKGVQAIEVEDRRALHWSQARNLGLESKWRADGREMEGRREEVESGR